MPFFICPLLQGLQVAIILFMQQEIDDNRKILILKVCEGLPDVAPLVYPIESFTRRVEMYEWLIRNKITGAKFVQFCADFRFRSMHYCNEIRKRSTHDRTKLLSKDLMK